MVEVGPVELGPEELRVLGCLIEKEHTTPDQYPLTMNSLVAACNQVSNRTPVVDYDHETVEMTLGLLRQRGVARAVLASGNRATKYRHVLDEAWGLTSGECAVLAVLVLRGAQTLSELRARTERYSGLEDIGGTEGVLDRLAIRYERPYVRCLGRQPGQREERWAHLLGGEPEIFVPPAGASALPRASDRMALLEEEVAALRGQVQGLQNEVANLRDLL